MTARPVLPGGYQCLVLHAHLPYIRHPEYTSFLEENWLFEAISETYLPLLELLERLRDEGFRDCLTLSLSPPLLTMLRDPFLQARYLAHLDKLHQLAREELQRTRGDAAFAPLARLYAERLTRNVTLFDTRYRRDLPAAFGALQAAGVIELITTAATHGYLPLLKAEPAAVRAQVLVGAQVFRDTFGHAAPGIWLPECGYYPGLEAVLEEAGCRYFFVDGHGILNATPHPNYGLLAPLACPNGVAAFGRDPDSSRRVWSREVGYPGDPAYRDFYRDIGFDLDFERIRPFILDGSTRIATGFKYYRIGSQATGKTPYDPALAMTRVAAHAADFVQHNRRQIALAGQPAFRPLIVSPYDAELFGHWWFEGPLWLDAVIRAMAEGTVALTTPSRYLASHPRLQAAIPSASSWGEGGYSGVWLNPDNDWIYPHLHDAARRMQALTRQHDDAPAGSPRFRALQQAGRSLLLAQASDWAFIMKADTAREYAEKRTRDFLARFNYLEASIRQDTIDERKLQALEVMDRIFPNLPPSVYA